MENTKSRLWISLAVYALWIAATLVGGQMLLGGETASLEQLVSQGIGWNFVVAIVVLLLAIVIFRWKDLAFDAPHSLARTMWFPLIILALISSPLLSTGMPTTTVVAFVGINTAMVGFSEEVMFRGIIFRALEERMRIWPAIILTSILFGSVHLGNVFITGDLFHAALQSTAAAMSGFIFMAILIRTGSIWPAIIYHFLWDYFLFLSGAASAQQGAEVAAPTGGWVIALPLLIALPNFLCALFLLRNVGKDDRGESHA